MGKWDKWDNITTSQNSISSCRFGRVFLWLHCGFLFFLPLEQLRSGGTGMPPAPPSGPQLLRSNSVNSTSSTRISTWSSPEMRQIWDSRNVRNGIAYPQHPILCHAGGSCLLCQVAASHFSCIHWRCCCVASSASGSHRTDTAAPRQKASTGCLAQGYAATAKNCCDVPLHG